MITATKYNVPTSTNAFQEAKDKLKKISLLNDNNPLTTNQYSKDEQQERTLAIVTYTGDFPAIKNHIAKEGFTIIKEKMIKLSSEQAIEFYADHLSQNYYEKMIRWLSSGLNICALILEKKNAVNDWKSLMGPVAYKKARKSSPNSIRALFGKDTSQNATHGSDSEASAKKEIAFIFSDSLLDVSAELHHQKNNDIVPVALHTEKNETYIPSPNKIDQVNDDMKMPTSAEKEGPSNAAVSGKIAVGTFTEKNNVKQFNDADIDKTIVNLGNQTPNVAAVDTKEGSSSISDNMKKLSSVVIIGATKDKSAIVSYKKEVDLSVTDTDKDRSVTAENVNGLYVNTEIIPNKIDLVIENKDDDNVPAEGNNKDSIPTEDKNEDKNEEIRLTKDNTEEKLLLDEEKDISLADTVEDSIKNENTAIKVGTIQKASICIVPGKKSNTCTEITPDPSVKDEEIATSVSNTVNGSTPVDSGKQSENTTLFNAETNTITPPSENDLILSVNSSASLNINVQDENLNKPSETVVNSSGISKERTLTKAVVKKEAIIPSSSRIRPPSIKRGHNGNMIQSGEPLRGTRIASNKISSANSSVGTTRIARLKPSVAVKNEALVIEKKRAAFICDTPKKTASIVSKNLPRVATMSALKQPTKEDHGEGDKKTKKRSSSTKSFISRLTAPTVASRNKKADNDTTTVATSGSLRRTTMSGKRNSVVRPTSPTSKKIETRSK